MVAQLLKRVASRLPASVQHELRRRFFARQIRGHRFLTDEKEYGRLGEFLGQGDWALDIGANVGHYAMRMSELVGVTGRVIAFEPVPETFALLAANARLFPHANVSLLNVAVSDRTGSAGMQVPMFAEGLRNYYQAHFASGAGELAVLAIAVDALAVENTVRLVKIDVEGHEMPVLRGMQRLLERDHPALIVETNSAQAMSFLEDLRYHVERLPGSSNVLCTKRTDDMRMPAKLAC